MTMITRRKALIGLGSAGLAGIGALGFGLAGRTKAPAAAPTPTATPPASPSTPHASLT